MSCLSLYCTVYHNNMLCISQYCALPITLLCFVYNYIVLCLLQYCVLPIIILCFAYNYIVLCLSLLIIIFCYVYHFSHYCIWISPDHYVWYSMSLFTALFFKCPKTNFMQNSHQHLPQKNEKWTILMLKWYICITHFSCSWKDKAKQIKI